MASRDEVLAWIASTPEGEKKRGPTAAARHFGISLNTIKTWRRNPHAPTKGARVRPSPSEGEGGKRGAPPAEELHPDARSKVETAIDHQLAVLADATNAGTTKAKNAAITLGILADKWGGVMRVRQGTGTTADDAADLAQIARLERKYTAPALTLVSNDDDAPSTAAGASHRGGSRG